MEKVRFVQYVCSVFMVLILCCSCSLFRSADEVEAQSDLLVSSRLYQERIVSRSEKRIFEEKRLVLVCVKDLPVPLIESLQNVLKNESIRLEILYSSDFTHFPALLRSGRADLMAGNFTEKQIQSFHLMPLLPYEGFCFAVREKDKRLYDLLKNMVLPSQKKKEKGTLNDEKRKKHIRRRK